MSRFRADYVHVLEHWCGGRLLRKDRISRHIEVEAKDLRQAERRIVSALKKRHRWRTSYFEDVQVYEVE